jgi:hypothetical protein
MYRIKHSYRTGDSFHSEDMEEMLEFEWTDLEACKDALQRIREHYKWYESVTSSSRFSPEPEDRPQWHIDELNVKGMDKASIPYMIVFKSDKGKLFQFYAPWCGYFETLYGAEIVLDEKITI